MTWSGTLGRGWRGRKEERAVYTKVTEWNGASSRVDDPAGDLNTPERKLRRNGRTNKRVRRSANLHFFCSMWEKNCLFASYRKIDKPKRTFHIKKDGTACLWNL